MSWHEFCDCRTWEHKLILWYEGLITPRAHDEIRKAAIGACGIFEIVCYDGVLELNRFVREEKISDLSSGWISADKSLIFVGAFAIKLVICGRV